MSDQETLIDLMQDMRVALLTTTAEDGSLHAVPMARQEVDLDTELWFITVRDSDHVRNLQARPSVGVTFSSSSAWVSVSGTAELVDDREQLESLWNTFADAWLPGGPDNPDAALIRVDLSGGSYWDSPGGRVASLISFVKSRVTGEPYEADHGTTSL
jgi:general stress protein 26